MSNVGLLYLCFILGAIAGGVGGSVATLFVRGIIIRAERGTV